MILGLGIQATQGIVNDDDIFLGVHCSSEGLLKVSIVGGSRITKRGQGKGRTVQFADSVPHSELYPCFQSLFDRRWPPDGDPRPEHILESRSYTTVRQTWMLRQCSLGRNKRFISYSLSPKDGTVTGKAYSGELLPILMLGGHYHHQRRVRLGQ